MAKSKQFNRYLFALVAVFVLALSAVSAKILVDSEPMLVYADNLNGYSNGGSSGVGTGGEVSQDDIDIGDWIKQQRGMTGEQMQGASDTLAPLSNAVGYVIGGITVCIFLAMFLMTALDLLYIVFPPIRNTLHKGAQQQQQGGAMGGAGMYGGRGMYGGMGGMGMQQGGMQAGGEKPRQWVSDEAVFCATLLANSQQPQSGAMGGAMGGVGMMGAQQPQQQAMPMKSVISVYFKKRIFFIILLTISVIVLSSSVLLGTGVNLAKWLLKLIDLLNGYIPV